MLCTRCSTILFRESDGEVMATFLSPSISPLLSEDVTVMLIFPFLTSYSLTQASTSRRARPETTPKAVPTDGLASSA